MTRWWVLGPIPNPENALWGKRLGPEGGVDPAKPMEIEGASYRWRAHDAPDGMLSLGEVGYSAERAIAYLFAEIVVPPGDALFKLGSDDYVACFLNGEKVHEHKGKRGLSADQDTVRVKLREGKNAVLLEVGNQGSDWGACLRVTNLVGKPIPPRQGGLDTAPPR
ncbi:MAG TPA: hypothetical protein VFV24_04310 [Candidatus Eisenbacteria bacterium]|nr:hypothetical protein [Candidatus Eisenbacteria bacterium]